MGRKGRGGKEKKRRIERKGLREDEEERRDITFTGSVTRLHPYSAGVTYSLCFINTVTNLFIICFVVSGVDGEEKLYSEWC